MTAGAILLAATNAEAFKAVECRDRRDDPSTWDSVQRDKEAMAASRKCDLPVLEGSETCRLFSAGDLNCRALDADSDRIARSRQLNQTIPICILANGRCYFTGVRVLSSQRSPLLLVWS